VTRSKRTPTDEDGQRQDWSHLLSVGGLIGAVLGVLLLAATLRTDAPSSPLLAPTTPPPTVDAARPIRPTAAVPTEASVLPPVAPVDRLARRASADLERIAQDGDGWTAQLAVLCDPARVAPLIDRFGDRTALHVLPSLHQDNPCFRICWNRYPTRDEAKRAADLPAALRAIEARPLPKQVAEVVR
jgi:septal ring-binding cell division protein DamX